MANSKMKMKEKILEQPIQWVQNSITRRTHSSHFDLVFPKQVELKTLPPLSLYIHLPWCVRKCPYCDFNSHEKNNLNKDEELQYINALLLDLEHALPQIWGRSVQSIFLGGGTPSLFSVSALERLLEGIRARVRLRPDAEITLEANPATVEADKFKGFSQIGFNRLSIGIQSFQDEFLKRLGRVHSAREAMMAVEVAAQSFDRFNLDLMFALPEQNLSQLLFDLKTALSFNPLHLSYYHLTIEPNTVFAKYPPANLPDEDTGALFYETLEQQLAEQGFQHYETSAWAKPGYMCEHNLNYWQFGDYLGIGAGAHSKLSFAEQIIRQSRTHNPATYMENVQHDSHIKQNQVVTPNELPLEFLMNVLRLEEGVSASFFENRTGLSIRYLQDFFDKALQKKWIDPDMSVIRASKTGRWFLNDLLSLV